MSRIRNYWLPIAVPVTVVVVLTVMISVGLKHTPSPTPAGEVPVTQIPAGKVLFLEPGQSVVFRLTRSTSPWVEVQKGVLVNCWRTDFGEITSASPDEICYTAPKEAGVVDMLEYRLPKSSRPLFYLMIMTLGDHQTEQFKEAARKQSVSIPEEWGEGEATFRLRVISPQFP